MEENLSIGDLCSYEGMAHKEVMGNRGPQINIKECPECGRDNWKVYFNAETSLGNCFGCSKNFNIFTFVVSLLKARGASVSDSRAAGRYIAEINAKLGYRPRAKKTAEVVAYTNEDIQLPSSAELPYSDGWVHPYLLKRGIDGHYAARFKLRYSAFGVHVYRDEKGNPVSQSFAERIIIPVYDLDGELVTFQGRDCSGTSEKRYKFAGGLPGTGRFIYQAHIARFKRSTHLVMGEGAFDTIGIQKALDTDPAKFSDTLAVGSWGKHLSHSSHGTSQLEALIRLKKTGLKHVTVMYDPEPAAYLEGLKACELITEAGLDASIALLPKGVDPGDASSSVIKATLNEAKRFTRISALKLKMNNPYS